MNAINEAADVLKRVRANGGGGLEQLPSLIVRAGDGLLDLDGLRALRHRAEVQRERATLQRELDDRQRGAGEPKTVCAAVRQRQQVKRYKGGRRVHNRPGMEILLDRWQLSRLVPGQAIPADEYDAVAAAADDTEAGQLDDTDDTDDTER